MTVIGGRWFVLLALSLVASVCIVSSIHTAANQLNRAAPPEGGRLDRVASTVVVNDDDYLSFVERALDGMAAILDALGDDLANRRPDLPGANSPYAIVTHCLGVVEYWAGHLVAGRQNHRDRPAEFTATGAVKGLIARIDAAKRQLRHDLAAAEASAPLRHDPPADQLHAPPGRTQGGALLHVYEELAQHLGQLEITRDVIVQRNGVPQGR